MIKKSSLSRSAALTGLTASFVLLAAQASAHAKLESTMPKADSAVNSPKTIEAHFSEAIEIRLSSLKLTTSDGTAVTVMSVNDPKDPATLSIKPNTPLKPGAYKVTWSVVSDDGHKTHGVFSFTVR